MNGFLIRVLYKREFNICEYYFDVPPMFISKYQNEFLDISIWGDPINFGTSNTDPEEISSPKDLIQKFSGHFFYLICNKRLNTIYIGNSTFSIIPIYYYQATEALFISSSPELIINNTSGTFAFSKQFIIEKLLFNYPFNNCALFNGIKCLNANSYLRISSNEYQELVHTDIVEWFTDSPIGGTRVLSSLSEIFLSQIRHYLPHEPYYVSFTSGFDGRTLLASSFFYNRKFTAYSFGKANSEDIVIPKAQSQLLNINYRPIILDEENYLNNAIYYGQEFAKLSNANGNLSRAHYYYAVKDIAQNCNYLVTGNFGSELLRSFHSPGVMITPFLFELINSNEKEKVINNLESRPELKYIQYSNYGSEITILKDRLTDYFKNIAGLDKNKILYKIVFEEVFRKYFGAELSVQNSFINNRTPFLDQTFVKQLLRTKYAGVNSNFFENNPFKRFKGQILYAYLLKKANYPLFTFKTGKGYRPSDLLSFYGQLKIANAYFSKKLGLRKESVDPFAVQDVYNLHRNQLLKLNFDNDYYFIQELKNSISETDVFGNTLSNYITLKWLTETQNAKV